MDPIILIWLFPIVFMLHDFEEIIMFRPWYRKNREFLLSKYPRLASKIVKHFDGLTTSSFAFIAAEEFFVFSAVSFTAYAYGAHYLWFGAVTVFGIHLIVHIAQFMIIRAYIPVILTSIPALAYCVYSVIIFAGGKDFNLSLAIIWSFISAGALLGNFIALHKAALRFEQFLKSYE